MKPLIRLDPARLASLYSGGMIVYPDGSPIAILLLADALNPWVIELTKSPLV